MQQGAIHPDLIDGAMAAYARVFSLIGFFNLNGFAV
jgi:hypothetical protein